MSKNSEIKCIEKALINDRNIKLVVTLTCLVFGIWAISYNFKHNSWFLGIVGLTSILASVRLLTNVLKHWKVNQIPLMFLLNNESTTIVVAHLCSQK